MKTKLIGMFMAVAGCTATAPDAIDYRTSAAALAAENAPTCEKAADCATALCLNTGFGKICTKHCAADAECDAGWHCETWHGMTKDEQYCAPGPRINWQGGAH